VIPRVTCGTLLERDLGCSSVWVRHNSGLRISDNRRELTGLLDWLVEAWPVPVEDVVNGSSSAYPSGDASRRTAVPEPPCPSVVAHVIRRRPRRHSR